MSGCLNNEIPISVQGLPIIEVTAIEVSKLDKVLQYENLNMLKDYDNNPKNQEAINNYLDNHHFPDSNKHSALSRWLGLPKLFKKDKPDWSEDGLPAQVAKDQLNADWIDKVEYSEFWGEQLKHVNNPDQLVGYSSSPNGVCRITDTSKYQKNAWDLVPASENEVEQYINNNEQSFKKLKQMAKNEAHNILLSDSLTGLYILSTGKFPFLNETATQEQLDIVKANLLTNGILSIVPLKIASNQAKKVNNISDATTIVTKHTDTSNKTGVTNNTHHNNSIKFIKPTECSFHGSMQVKTLNGYKPIASIQKNDWVFSKNEITGETNYRQVLQTINSIDPDTTRITIVNSDGVKQTIISDGLHPYFVDFTGDTTPPKPSTGHSYKGNLTHAYWVGAKDIEVGHRLIDEKGNYQTVISIHTEQTPLNSYNLEVDTDHTFFIKGIDGTQSVWVHNKDCWVDIPNNARQKQIGNDTVYEFEDNGRTVKVIENPEFSQKGGAQFFEVKVTGRGNKQKVTIIKENKPDITRDVNSNTIVVQQGEKGNWNQYLNKPEPNKRIVIEETGHIYHTDNLSRVSLVEADLRKLENDRNTNQQCKSGGCDRLPTDHGGHLIASMFNGLGEGINIVPMDAKFNGSGGAWYKMEDRWKNTLENNGTVQVKIEPIYIGNSKRPTSFKIREVVNGKLYEFTLQNTETRK